MPAAGTLIEGVGDEVTGFFVAWALALLAGLAWWTTHVTDRPLRIQTIIVGQRVIHVRGDGTEPEPAAEPADGAAAPEPAAAAPAPERPAAAAAAADAEQTPPEAAKQEPIPTPTGGDVSDPSEDDVDAETVEDIELSYIDLAAAEVEVEQAAAVRRRACHAAAVGRSAGSDGTAGVEPSRRRSCSPLEHVIDRELAARRLAHSRLPAADTGLHVPTGAAAAQSSIAADSPTVSSLETAAAGAIAEVSETTTEASVTTASSATFTTRTTVAAASVSATHSPVVSAVEASSASGSSAPQQITSAGGSTAEAATASGRSIMVKLKFLNDTQRLVEGSRGEALADFKRRHFPAETAANRLVRLIFNGRLLSDAETLDQCGLYHNCVVHCHVSALPRPPAGTAAAAAAAAAADAAEAPLDLSVLLCPALTSALTLVWGVRLRYPQLFSALATALLVLLTLLLAVFTAATFLPLQRPPAPPPPPPPARRRPSGDVSAHRRHRLGR